MTHFGSRSSHSADPSSGGEATAFSWRNVFKHAMRQSRWAQEEKQPAPQTPRPPHQLTPHSPIRRRRLLVGAFVLLALVVLVVLVVRFAFGPSSVQRGTAKVVSSGTSLLGLADSSKPKPSPSKPLVKETQREDLPPSPWISAPPSQPIQLNTPMPRVQRAMPAPSTPAPAPTPNIAPTQPANATARPAMPPQVFRARHDKHFGGSCSGQLTLNTAGLVFDCPNDPGESFQVALNEIGAVDDNGIRLLSGKKYHFSISGMSKSAEQALFASWLRQVR